MPWPRPPTSFEVTVLALIASYGDWVRLQQVGGTSRSRHWAAARWSLVRGYVETRKAFSNVHEYRITPEGLRYLEARTCRTGRGSQSGSTS